MVQYVPLNNTQVEFCFPAVQIFIINVADVVGWTRSQTDQFLKVEMKDECDDDHSLISAGCLPVSFLLLYDTIR